MSNFPSPNAVQSTLNSSSFSPATLWPVLFSQRPLSAAQPIPFPSTSTLSIRLSRSSLPSLSRFPPDPNRNDGGRPAPSPPAAILGEILRCPHTSLGEVARDPWSLPLLVAAPFATRIRAFLPRCLGEFPSLPTTDPPSARPGVGGVLSNNAHNCSR